MKKKYIVQTIRSYFADKPVGKAWLFGSFARNEQANDSDIDVLVEPDFPQPIGLEYVHWWMDLEEKLGLKIDLTCEENALQIRTAFCRKRQTVDL